MAVVTPIISGHYLPEPKGGEASVDPGYAWFLFLKNEEMPIDSATPRTIRASSIILAKVQANTSLSYSIHSMRSTLVLASLLAAVPVRSIPLVLIRTYIRIDFFTDYICVPDPFSSCSTGSGTPYRSCVRSFDRRGF